MAWKIFTGVEIEGKYTGQTTLFIEGTPPDTAIISAMDNNAEITQIYFGAYYKQYVDYPSVFEKTQVSFIAKKFNKVLVTLPVLYLRPDLLRLALENSNVEFVVILKVSRSYPGLFNLYEIVPSSLRQRVQVKHVYTAGVSLVDCANMFVTDKLQFEDIQDLLIAEGN